jgi:hypothetical protein
MSTQPIDRRRLAAVRRRRPETSRIVMIGLVFAAVFAASFLLGHTRAGTGGVAERLPPSLPTMATPVPAALSSAPPLELGVAAPPPAKSKAPREAAPFAAGASTTTTALPASAPVVAPTASAPTASKPKAGTAPASPAPKVPVSGGSPAAPETHRSPSPGSTKRGSGQGSFDSSG